MKRLAALLLFLAAPAWPTSTCRRRIGPIASSPIARQEAKAKALMEQLRCLVCQGQSIADSDAELAGDMRHMVRSRIAAGEKPATCAAG